MTAHALHMLVMGLLVSVVAPALVLVLGRLAPALDRYTLPTGVIFPGFIVLHAAITVLPELVAPVGPVPDILAHLALLTGAVLFWAPVLGIRHRLPEGGRSIYLYAAMPLLDLAGVWLVALGDDGGIAMIVGMIPMGVAAVVILWRWIAREERRAQLDEMAGLSTSGGG